MNEKRALIKQQQGGFNAEIVYVYALYEYSNLSLNGQTITRGECLRTTAQNPGQCYPWVARVPLYDGMKGRKIDITFYETYCPNDNGVLCHYNSVYLQIIEPTAFELQGTWISSYALFQPYIYGIGPSNITVLGIVFFVIFFVFVVFLKCFVCCL